MNQDAKWQTDVTELVAMLRECLIALLPPLERAKIWPACYDDWDDIVSSLFRNVVVRTVEFGVNESMEGKLQVPRYGLAYDDYSGMSFVEVIHPDISDVATAVFVELNEASTFEDAVYISLDAEGEVASGAELVPVARATYRFQWRDSTGHLHPMDKLSVKL